MNTAQRRERLEQLALGGDAHAADVLLRCLSREGDTQKIISLARARGVTVPHMVKIHAGTDVLGTPSRDNRWGNERQLEVTFDRSFWMGSAPVTQAEYEAVMGSNPSHYSTGENASQRPVECVSWFDAVEYCNKLSVLCGLPVAYVGDRTQGFLWRGGPGFRLPTEVEWEYAARAGSDGARYEVPDGTGGWRQAELDEIAWYDGNSHGRTHAVRQKIPNRWGLYDVLGNVWCWCWDEYKNEMSVGQPDIPFDSTLFQPRPKADEQYCEQSEDTITVASGTSCRPPEEPVGHSESIAEAEGSESVGASDRPFAERAGTGSSAVAAGASPRSPAARRIAATYGRRAAASTSNSAPHRETEVDLPFDERAWTGSSTVAAGATSRSTAARLIATASGRRSTAATSASVSQEEKADLPFDERARSGSTAVAAGASSRRTAVRRSAPGARRRTAAGAWASASQEEEADRPFDERARTGSPAVAAGSTSRRTAARRFATSTGRRTAPTTSASASQEEKADLPFVQSVQDGHQIAGVPSSPPAVIDPLDSTRSLGWYQPTSGTRTFQLLDEHGVMDQASGSVLTTRAISGIPQGTLLGSLPARSDGKPRTWMLPYLLNTRFAGMHKARGASSSKHGPTLFCYAGMSSVSVMAWRLLRDTGGNVVSSSAGRPIGMRIVVGMM